MPTYVFVNMQWTGTSSIPPFDSVIRWGPNNGAMFTLGPDDQRNQSLVNAGNYLFPKGFTSILHPYW